MITYLAGNLIKGDWMYGEIFTVARQIKPVFKSMEGPKISPPYTSRFCKSIVPPGTDISRISFTKPRNITHCSDKDSSGGTNRAIYSTKNRKSIQDNYIIIPLHQQILLAYAFNQSRT